MAIPESLYQSGLINLRFAPSMRGKIAMNNGYIYIPRSTPLRVLDHSYGSNASYVFNIGSYVSGPNDFLMQRGRDEVVR